MRWTVTITLRLSPEEERALAERAARDGKHPAEFIHEMIRSMLQVPMSVDEALAPFRRQIEESGLSDDELEVFFEEVREDIWRDKQAGPDQG